MKRRKQPAHSQLFQVRMWREDLGAGQTEWRGKVQHVLSGRRRYFREWPDLLAYLQEMLSEVESDEGSGEGGPMIVRHLPWIFTWVEVRFSGYTFEECLATVLLECRLRLIVARGFPTLRPFTCDSND